MSEYNMSSPADRDADACITTMVAASVACALVPAHVNWALFATALGSGVVAIGNCYGVSLDGSDGWKLVKQFFLAAGLTFLGLTVGAKILAAILSTTGLGHFAAVPLDAAVSAAIAFAVGKSGQAYFKGERDKARLGEIFRDAFRQKRANPE